MYILENIGELYDEGGRKRKRAWQINAKKCGSQLKKKIRK